VAFGDPNRTTDPDDPVASERPLLRGILHALTGSGGSLLGGLLSSTAYSETLRVPVDDRDSLEVGGSVSSATTIFSQDMTGYESITVQVTSAGSGCTITYETSDNDSNWVSTGGLLSTSVGANSGQTTSTSTQILQFARRGKFFRARVSAYGSGTVTLVATLSKAPVCNIGVVAIGNTAQVAAGQAGHDTPIAGAPVRIAGRAVTANYATVTNGDTADLLCTLVGALIQKPYAIPEQEWSYAAASGGITGTSDVEIKAAAAAGIRNYLTDIDITNAHASVATEVVVKDGSTVIWRSYFPALSVGARHIHFANPLRSTAATALNVACITTGTATYVNAQGYTAP
jgi:hypothetical protein